MGLILRPAETTGARNVLIRDSHGSWLGRKMLNIPARCILATWKRNKETKYPAHSIFENADYCGIQITTVIFGESFCPLGVTHSLCRIVQIRFMFVYPWIVSRS